MRHWFEHNGECFLPAREVMTGIGAVPVQVPLGTGATVSAAWAKSVEKLLP